MLLPQALNRGGMAVEITKAAVRIAVRKLGFVLPQQQCTGDALPRQLLMRTDAHSGKAGGSWSAATCRMLSPQSHLRRKMSLIFRMGHSLRWHPVPPPQENGDGTVRR
jgi:hypothetical protein